MDRCALNQNCRSYVFVSEEFTLLLTWHFPLHGTAGRERGGISALPKTSLRAQGVPAAAGLPLLKDAEACVVHQLRPHLAFTQSLH